MRIATEEQAVLDKAREFAMALGASRPFKDYERALEEFRNDRAGASLLSQFTQLQQEVSMEQQLWGDPDPERAEQLRTLQERMKSHPSLEALQRSESALLSLVLSSIQRLSALCEIDYVEACTGRSLSGCGPAQGSEDLVAALAANPEVSVALEDLADSLHQPEACRAFADARTSFRNDPELNRLREEMQQAQRRYLQAQNKGQVTLEIIERVRAAQNRLREHPSILKFSKAKREVDRLFQAVNQAVSEVAGMDPAQILAPAGGCCG